MLFLLSGKILVVTLVIRGSPIARSEPIPAGRTALGSRRRARGARDRGKVTERFHVNITYKLILSVKKITNSRG